MRIRNAWFSVFGAAGEMPFKPFNFHFKIVPAGVFRRFNLQFLLARLKLYVTGFAGVVVFYRN